MGVKDCFKCATSKTVGASTCDCSKAGYCDGPVNKGGCEKTPAGISFSYVYPLCNEMMLMN